MHFRKIILLLFLCFSAFCIEAKTSPKSGGYLGRKNILGCELNYHPLYRWLGIRYEEGNGNLWNMISLRPSYEYAVTKSSSFIFGGGFQHFSHGDITNGNTLVDEVKSDKFYITGGDISLGWKFYYYKYTGRISPLGGYCTFTVGIPFYKTVYKDEEIVKNQWHFGAEVGKQSILKKYFVIDRGIKSNLSISDAWMRWTQSEYDYTGSPADKYYYYSQVLSVYVRIGYIL